MEEYRRGKTQRIDAVHHAAVAGDEFAREVDAAVQKWLAVKKQYEEKLATPSSIQRKP